MEVVGLAMAIQRELSLSLIGLAGGLLVGNFAAFNGFLSLADTIGDQVVTSLLTGSTLLLTISIIFGGKGISVPDGQDASGLFNLQAVVGLLGLLTALAMPVSSLGFKAPVNESLTNQVSVMQSAVAAANSERSAMKSTLDEAASERDELSKLVEQLQTQIERPPSD